MHPLVSLAKSAVEVFIKERRMIFSPPDFPQQFLKEKSGTFVTIEKRGQLRGCIGTYLPLRKNIAEEIIQNAITAATEDYRFGPIETEELPDLSFLVYILQKPQSIKKIEELNPQKFGIIVKTLPILDKGDVVFNGHFVPKSGLLLPGLEGIDTVEKQISLACQKAGINPVKERITIYKFTVKKYK